MTCNVDRIRKCTIPDKLAFSRPSGTFEPALCEQSLHVFALRVVF